MVASALPQKKKTQFKTKKLQTSKKTKQFVNTASGRPYLPIACG
jgi:hypothetical protein